MVSIIIISYNTQDLTRQCLESIEKYVDLKQHEVIVVDNGSTDGSAEMIEKDFKFVHLIINSSNLGFAIANNQAIKIAKGDLIWLLNSDTQLTQKGMPEKLEEFFQQHPEAGALATRLLNPDGSDQPSLFHFPTLWRGIKQYWLGRKRWFDKYQPTLPAPSNPFPDQVEDRL